MWKIWVEIDWLLCNFSSSISYIHCSSVPVLPILPLAFFSRSVFFKKMKPLSHTFSILDVAFHTSLSHVVLRVIDVKPTTFGSWQLYLPSPGWIQCSIPNVDRENKLSYLKKGLLQMVWVLRRTQKKNKNIFPLLPMQYIPWILLQKHFSSLWKCKIYYFFMQSYLSWDYEVKFINIMFWNLPQK